jgi:hypothetical protein
MGALGEVAMGMHYSIKGYAELQVIADLMARWDQRQALARTIAHLYYTEAWTED